MYSIPLVEQIAEFLTNAIIEGRLENGERLVENELQRKFKVSRSPIREAFRILERNGLVIITPRKGTFVRKISQRDIEEYYPIRACLEGLAARLAIPHLEANDIETMKSGLSGMKNAVREKDFKSYFKYHSEFNKVFIYASMNGALIGMLENLRLQSMCFKFSHFYFREYNEDAVSVHREILDLFIKKDADRLEAFVKEHILNALDGFLQFMASKSA
jgi:DNA-binding GntR family transcriptional regulator